MDLKDWQLRDFPVELKNRAKAAAARQNKTLKNWVIEAVQNYLKKGAK